MSGQIPRALPELRFQNEAGRRVSLTDFRGKPVLLHLWATWCVPCREELPALDRLQAQLGDAIEVLAVSLDPEGAELVRRFYQSQRLHHLRIYTDTAGRLLAVTGVPGLPATLLIDSQGREIGRHAGMLQWDSVRTVELLERLAEDAH